jgi:predicted DNA-binding transcriptional regulator AlpA
MNEGGFPCSIKLSTKAVGWQAAELEDWLEKRIKAKLLNQAL